jgi:CHRD domain
MRRLTLHAALIGALLLVFGAGTYALAQGGTGNISSDDMSGYLEAPPVSSVAEGDFRATIDDETNTVEYTLSYSGLEGDVRQAHIHFGQRSVSGGIIVWLCETAANPSPTGPATPDCVQSGSVTGTFGAADVIGPAGQGIAAGEFEELVAAIRAGRTYANVHSTKFPPGEIRGQLNDRDQRDD